jgi:preprotein translocase subunit SecE
VKAILGYLKDVRLELTKVTWPKKEEVTRLTLLVFVTSAIVAIYVGGLDFTFTKLLSIIVSR